MGLGYVRYRATTASGETFRFAADLTEASAGIYLVDRDGEEFVTPWRTADARHRPMRAAELLADDEDEVIDVTADEPSSASQPSPAPIRS